MTETSVTYMYQSWFACHVARVPALLPAALNF